VLVGSGDDPYADPTYADAMTFTIGSTISCDCFVTGRYLAIRIESATAYQWRLDSFEIEYEIRGDW
jgi:hypothetical protein